MLTIGVDEVGRGCWAGPLVAGCVVFPEVFNMLGLRDSKTLTARRRDNLAEEIRERALGYGLGWVEPAEIDRIGLTAAVGRAMHCAIQDLAKKFDITSADIVIDGNYNFLKQYQNVRTLIKADALLACVSAASIIAKVSRDEYMRSIAHEAHPTYGFDSHVGYGTALHRQMLAKHGVTPIHRRSYRPVQAVLQSTA